MTSLSIFIRDHTNEILSEWEVFARGLPIGNSMSIGALRDHAKAMLDTVVADLQTSQTTSEQASKSKGESDAGEKPAETAAQEHGAGRAESGFSIEEMVSEFRALRASVISLWTKEQETAGHAELEELTRFNEAIDQAIAESIARYSRSIALSRDRFLAILGHDLRTPIGAIIMSSTFVYETGGLDEPQRVLVGRIASSARRMNQMVADLLDFTRTSLGGKIPVAPVQMDVGDTVRNVVAEVKASAPNATFEVAVSGALSGMWDEARLTQALTNLVTNAVHHGAPSTPITIEANGTPNEVVISVHNVGPAIPEEMRRTLFQVMPQERKGDANDGHLGLGLYIVDQIVKAHGGSVTVRSSEVEGTTFRIQLPRSPGGHGATLPPSR